MLLRRLRPVRISLQLRRAFSSDADSKVAAMLEQAHKKASAKGEPIAVTAVKADGSTKRFYQDVSVEKDSAGFGVALDKRRLFSARQTPITVPTEDLATALAIEWDSQTNRVRPTSMPLMRLTTVAIDQVRENRKMFLDGFMKTLRHDATLLRAKDPPGLVKVQHKFWDPLLEWVKKDYGMHFNLTASILPLPQPQSSMDKAAAIMAHQNEWVTSAADQLAYVSKSLIIALAVLTERINLKPAFDAARCDESYQIRKYGLVEGIYGHTVDIEWTKQQLAACRTFLNLLGTHGVMRATTDRTVEAFPFQYVAPSIPQPGKILRSSMEKLPGADADLDAPLTPEEAGKDEISSADNKATEGSVRAKMRRRFQNVSEQRMMAETVANIVSERAGSNTHKQQ